MDDKQFTVVVDKLDKVLKLLAIETVRGLSREQDKIELLDNLGFKSGEIDKLLGKNQGYSSVVLSQLKKKKQPKPVTNQTVGTSTTPTTSEVTA